MTEDDAKAELERLLSDRWWRLCNLYWVVNEQGKAVRFVPNEAQKKLWDELHTFNVIPKARQLGFSTFIAIFILDTCLFRENTAAGIVDITVDDAKGKLEKIKFAYERLPEQIRTAIPLKKENATEIEWINKSSVSVGTSHRGGTLQILHVSEYGKISAQFPDKAKEVRTGAFGTVHGGGMIFVESTAEGVGGDFHELVKEADDQRKMGRTLAEQQFKLHFFPWHENPNYCDDKTEIVIPKEMDEYFRELEGTHGIKLSKGQKVWYVLKRKLVGPDDMGREYPAHLDEAFNASVLGAYFKPQMSKAREQRRIGKVPVDPSRPVNTFWDIGKSDNTTIWFHQGHGPMHHFVHYYENNGEGVEFYARKLKEIASERGFTYGTHYGPHDLDNSHWILPGQKRVIDVARNLGIVFRVVPRIDNKANAIEAARNMLSMSWIDEEHCERGIQCLDNYRKKWDERRATFRSEPEHDWSSHGADGFMTGACGYMPEYIPPPQDKYQRGRRRRSSSGSSWAA